MAQLFIGVGAVADDNTGDPLRTAFIKANANFTELYTGVSRPQRSVTASPVSVNPTDGILNCNIPTPATCTLPTAVGRNGVPITFKDVGGQFFVNNLVITAFGSETIDGQSTYTLANNHAGVTLTPFNDTGGIVGWFVT